MQIAADMCATVSLKTGNHRNIEDNIKNNNYKKAHNKDESPYLTPENFVERTVDGLLNENPGELIKTGSPHVVSILFQ